MARSVHRFSLILLLAVVVTAQAHPYMRYPLREARRGTGFTVKWALDFGRADSPVREGFKAVTAEMALTPEAEFGWRDVKDIREYHARTDYRGKAAPVDILYCPYQELALTDLNEDCLWGRSPAEFHIRLPKGTYNLYYMGGVPRLGSFGGGDYIKFDIALNNQIHDTICIPMPSIFENRRYTIEIGEDGLNITLRPATVWAVNGLVVYPAEQEEEVEACVVAPLEEEVYLLPEYSTDQSMRTLTKLSHEEPRPLPELTAEERARGYIVFVRDWTERIFPNTNPTRAEIGAPVALFATPGEFEPACLTVRALEAPCRDVSVTVSMPKSAGGSTFPPDSIVLSRVQYQWLALGSGRPSSPGVALKGKIAPHFLDALAVRTDIPAGTNQSYWLNIRVPEEAVPGVYEGTIMVAPEGLAAVEVPLRIRVLPFRLKDRPDFVRGVYYDTRWSRTARIAKDPVVREEGRKRAEQEARDFREHGIQCFNWSHWGADWSIDLEKGQVTPSDPTFPSMAQAVEFYRLAGCTGPIVGTPLMQLYGKIEREVLQTQRPDNMRYGQQWHRKDMEISPAALDLLTEGTRILQAHIREQGYPEFLYYILDESDGQLMRKLYGAVKRVPGARTYSTSANYAEDIGPWLDVACSTGSFLARGEWTGDVRERAERGEYEAWAYPNSTIYGYDGSQESCRYVWGFYAWKMGLRGLMPWMYTTNNGKGNPFNQFDRDYPDTGFVMPGPDGLISTLRWDGAREGMNDMRYVYTLTAWIEQAAQSANTATRTLAGQARQALEELKAEVPEQYRGPEVDLWTAQNATAYRWYIATWIMKLQSAQHGAE